MTEHFDIDDLFVGQIVLRAEIQVLKKAFRTTLSELQVQTDLLHDQDKYYQQRLQEIEFLFLNLEDSNPALAARLHDRLEEAKKSLDKGNY